MAFNPVTGNYDSLEDAGYTRGQIDAFFNDLVKSTGASYQSGDAENLIAKLVGGSGYISAIGGDPRLAFGEFTDQYRRRGFSDPGLGVSSELLQIGTTRAELQRGEIRPAGPAPKAPTASRSLPGPIIYNTAPPPAASIVTTLGATESNRLEPTSGPTGLAYAADPVNYSTMDVAPGYGYLGLQSGNYGGAGYMADGFSEPLAGLSGDGALAALPGDRTMVYLLLGGAALAAYFLLAK